MKLTKKDIGRICKVVWLDARLTTEYTLEELIKKGFMINTTLGWLKYFDKDKVILSHEFSNDSPAEQLTLIPYDWIDKVTFLKEE